METLTKRVPAMILGLLPFLLLWNGGMDPRAVWVLGIVTGILTLWECTQKNTRGLPQMIGIVAVLFAAWTALCFLTSSTQTWGFDELVRDISCMLLLWLAARRTEQERSQILKMILAVVILSACIGMFIYLLEPGRRFVGTFLDIAAREEWPNAFASLLLIVWPLLFVLLPTTWAIAISGVLGGCLALTGSRGALLALVAQVSIAAWIWLRHRDKSLDGSKVFSLRMAMLCVCLLATVLIANGIRGVWFPVNDVTDRLTFALTQEPVTERMHYWNAALHMTGERPLLGWGPDSFGSAEQRYQTVALEISAHPHSVPLKIAAERGLPALLFFLVLIVMVLHAAFCRTHRHGTWATLVGLGLLGVLLHDLVDTTVLMTGIAIPFWILAGLVTGREETEDVSPLTKALLACTGVVLILMSASELLRPTMLRGATELDAAVELLAEGKLDEAKVQIDAFRRLSPEEPQGASVLSQFFVQKNQQEEAISFAKEAYEKGGWNTPQFSSAYLELLAFVGKTELVESMRDEMRAKVHSFADAIHMSRHGAAESGLANDVLHLLDTLTLVYPDARHEWEVLKENVIHDQEEWNAYFADRPKGFIW